MPKKSCTRGDSKFTNKLTSFERNLAKVIEWTLFSGAPYWTGGLKLIS